MILYAVATRGSAYLRDRHEHGVELTDVDHCSVYPRIEHARALAERYGIERTILIEMTVQERALPW